MFQHTGDCSDTLVMCEAFIRCLQPHQDVNRHSTKSSVAQVTAFREVTTMQRLRHIQGICRLHDFGICSDSIMLVMTKCRCSLREWRHRQPVNCHNQLKLYLNIFAQLAKLLQVCLLWCCPLSFCGAQLSGVLWQVQALYRLALS